MAHVDLQSIARQLTQGCTAGAVSRNGIVLWLTGLSGAGKTTIAERLHDRMSRHGLPCVLLDGDRLREIFGATGHHDKRHRLELALSYARLCHEISAMGVHVVCATMSLFHQVHDWNRTHIPYYVEIFLDVPLDELTRRDPKGIYRRAAIGELSDVVGIHFAPEEPQHPHLTIRNFGDLSAEQAADMIWPLLVLKLSAAQGSPP